jgi:hypothetical protein
VPSCLLCTEQQDRTLCPVVCPNANEIAFRDGDQCFLFDSKQFQTNAATGLTNLPVVRAIPFPFVENDAANHRVTLTAYVTLPDDQEAVLSIIFPRANANLLEVPRAYTGAKDTEIIVANYIIISGGTDANKKLFEEAYLVFWVPKDMRTLSFSYKVRFVWSIQETSEPSTDEEIKLEPKMG